MFKKTRLKYLCTSFNSNLSTDSVKEDGLYDVYGAGGYIGKLDTNKCQTEYLGIVKDGAGIGRVNKYPAKTSLLGTMAYIIPNKDVNIDWLKYCIDSLDLSFSFGQTTIPHIYFSEYGNRTVYVPALSEQLKIATFLDDKCTRISSLLSDLEEQLKVLGQYKKSIVYETITQGLNKEVEKVDSNSEWGKIPSHWKLVDIKYLFEIRKRIAGKEGYDILSVTQKGIKIKDISKNEGQIADNYSNYQFVYPDDFVMNHMDLLTGWVDKSVFFGVTSPDYRVFSLKDNTRNSLDYYKYVMQCCYMNRIFYSLGQGVSNLGRWRLQTSTFNNFKVPAPPKEDQEDIAVFLDKKCADIDSLIELKSKQITMLEKYKKSMIYEYITGKKEVRGK